MKYIWTVTILASLVVGCSDPYAPVKPSRTKSTPASPDAGVRAAGHKFAKKAITPALKAPTTAAFPWDTVTFSSMEPLSDNSGATMQRWLVRGAVDAENSFGAPIRSQWEVVVASVGNTFLMGEARLDGEVVFSLESYRALLETP